MVWSAALGLQFVQVDLDCRAHRRMSEAALVRRLVKGGRGWGFPVRRRCIESKYVLNRCGR
eukprot:scaffold86717_cov28-Tisochrysis_lutea.AAC.4